MASYVPVGDIKTKRLTKNLLWVTRTVNVDLQTGGATSSQVDADDTLQCIPLFKGDIVLQAGVHVRTACTGAASGDIGTGDLVDNWGDGMALDQTVATAGSDNQAAPKLITVADTLDLKVLEANITAGEFDVVALILRGV